MDKVNAARDEAAEKYCSTFTDEYRKCTGYTDECAFKAGWDACAAEYSDSHRYRIAMLEIEALNEEITALHKDHANDWKRIQDAERERDALKSEVERLNTARDISGVQFWQNAANEERTKLGRWREMAEKLAEAMGGCSDSNCRILGRRSGMSSNGGCHCPNNIKKARAEFEALKKECGEC